MSQELRSTLPKPFVFVLMPFDPKFDDIYKFGIKGAAEDIGAYAERIDEQIFVEGMLDRIFNQISKADVIVADMTGRNSNVFYEVGYAHALDKIVILLTQDPNDIPFDLKHRQHTVYGGKIDILRRELSTKIKWAIRESRQKVLDISGDDISLFVNKKQIASTNDLSEISDVEIVTNSRDIIISLLIKNDTREMLPSITHVYLFFENPKQVIPGHHDKTKEVNLFLDKLSKLLDEYELDKTEMLETENNLKAVDESHIFDDIPIESTGKLKYNIRLKESFPSIPPGAFEKSIIRLHLPKPLEFSESVIMVRLHTSNRYYDFPFKLKIILENSDS